MKIETKFDLEDTVFPIEKVNHNRTVDCNTCKGTGSIHINNTVRTTCCPDCRGRGVNTFVEEKEWSLTELGSAKIGKISVEILSMDNGSKRRVRYMLDKSGVGTGRLWEETDLFIQKDHAEQECDRRNEELRSEWIRKITRL